MKLDSARTHLGGRVGHTMCHATYETTHVTVLYELGHTLSDVIDKAHGVSQEVHGAQNLSCLADQLLQTGKTSLHLFMASNN